MAEKKEHLLQTRITEAEWKLVQQSLRMNRLNKSQWLKRAVSNQIRKEFE